MNLNQIINKYQNRLDEVYRISCAVTSAKVVSGTPVARIKGGSLRLSWTASIGKTVKAINIDNKNPTSMFRNDHDGVTNKLKPGDTYNFANAQPYARRIEYESWSPQAPQGMMRIATAQWQGIVRNAIRSAK